MLKATFRFQLQFSRDLGFGKKNFYQENVFLLIDFGVQKRFLQTQQRVIKKH